MAVEHKFLKNIVTSPLPDNVSGMPSTVTVTVDTTLVKPEDLESIAVSFNGQIIRKHSAEDTTPFAKYYYEVVNTNAAYLSSPNSVGVENQCSVAFNIHANQDFVSPGYSALSEHQRASFSDTDVFYISFYHTVVRDA